MVCHEFQTEKGGNAAEEMRAGPSESGCRTRAPNPLTLRWSRASVVNGEAKRRAGARQVGVRQTNASEPLMTCRKVYRRHRNRDPWLAREEEPRRGPADDLGGVRH